MIALDVVEYLVSARRVKTCGGLVQYEHLRLHSHYACDSHTALLTARKLKG